MHDSARVPDISPPESDRCNVAGEQRKKLSGRPFVKGDPRCNRKGRPRHFDDFRAFGLKLAQKKINDPKTGEELTFAEALIRKMATSDEPALIKLFIEYTFGKVPDKVEMSGELKTAPPVMVIRLAGSAPNPADRQPAFEPSRE